MIWNILTIKNSIRIFFSAFLMLVAISPLFGAMNVNAQAGSGSDSTCYFRDQRNNTTTRYPAGSCTYDIMVSAGGNMGALPNPFPAGKHCYYFPDSAAASEVNCDEPQFKNAPLMGDSNPPPVTTKCYKGEKGPDEKIFYTRIDCTADYQRKIGTALKSNECYLIETVDGKDVYKGNTSCDGPAAKEGDERAKTTTQPIGTGTVRTGTPGACPPVENSFFDIPTWYQFLEVGNNCAVVLDIKNNPNQIWLVALAIADILLRLAGFIAVLFVIYGGYRYITSQFDPEGTKNARDTILNALIGLVVAILAAALVNFVGGSIS